MGIQLLLSVPQAEDTDAHWSCSTSAVAQTLSSNLSQIFTQDPVHAKALLQSRDLLECMADGNVRMKRGPHKVSKPCGTKVKRETGLVFAARQERAFLSVGSLQSMRACDGDEAHLQKAHGAARKVLGYGHCVT